MIVHDPLYGEIRIPADLEALICTPEVRRLSQVRLLNTASPSLGVLGELRRYSHTLGVLHLCSRNRLLGFTKDEGRALAASVLVHDIGTPAFGHLLEYHLRDRATWSHEDVINDILWGRAVPENRAHQIFARRTLGFRHALRRARIDVSIVEAIAGGSHPLSALLFGTLDFDNLDNVCRMAWALGMREGNETGSQLAAMLGVNRDGSIELPRESGEALVNDWAALRAGIYNIVVFDGPTIASQAVLSDAIGRGFDAGWLSVDDWSLTDEELLAVLLEHEETKDAISREYWGRLPAVAVWAQLTGPDISRSCGWRQEAKARIERVLRHVCKKRTWLGYVFTDDGTFEKELNFGNPRAAGFWRVGKRSQSVILYGCMRSNTTLPIALQREALSAILGEFSASPDAVLRSSLDSVKDRIDGQGSLSLPA